MTPQQLPLNVTPMLPLREAYERTASIKAKRTFEQAMQVPALRTALRLYAEAIERARNAR